jgi:hypothetical protein
VFAFVALIFPFPPWKTTPSEVKVIPNPGGVHVEFTFAGGRGVNADANEPNVNPDADAIPDAEAEEDAALLFALVEDLVFLLVLSVFSLLLFEFRSSELEGPGVEDDPEGSEGSVGSSGGISSESQTRLNLQTGQVPRI